MRSADTLPARVSPPGARNRPAHSGTSPQSATRGASRVLASASLRALVTARVVMGDVNDPFYLVKEEISDTVAKAQTTSERLARLPAGNGERDKLAASVATECESVLWQLEELDRATAMAENDYARFKVDATELASRKRWTASTKRTVEGMRADAQRVLDAPRAAVVTAEVSTAPSVPRTTASSTSSATSSSFWFASRMRIWTKSA